ncbi:MULTISPECIES: LysR family transcriptional regulator [unclassified Chryseobacterium]|uniref:LysR family transcriptional regulator n=1 Tax=unclassified Chryseobacterium TaxID=2593645 RepID=UPI001AE72C6F|nr:MULTISPECIES: LysR family transcriptional regulator [unclassified Chryseobacterium]MBP1163256.1 DNA-binding transcriptional LysR family regulator [Chryseobacterium sp. PvR013]MDR4894594.1 LysR family transcriptional regulator [Chryseobacterium sp. CFS7]
MDIQQLKYFLALAKELHFWNTSAKMNITQSALSRQIQSLENELGVQLFYRDKRNVKLTPAGKFLQEKWGEELNQIDSFHQLARQIHLGESGTIRIAHPDSISSSVLPDFVRKVSAAFPNLNLELVQLTNEAQEDYLKNFKIDLAFSRDINSSSVINEKKLGYENLSFVVPENHQFKTLSDISEETLKVQKFLLTTGDYSSSYNLLVQEVIDSYNIKLNSYIRCEFGSTIISMIRNGLGISILPHSYHLHQNAGIRFIPLPFVTDLYIQWRKDDPNPILKNILELV